MKNKNLSNTKNTKCQKNTPDNNEISREKMITILLLIWFIAGVLWYFLPILLAN